MQQLILRIRPTTGMEDLDLDKIRARIQRLTTWQAELQDSRLSDAPYVSVIARIPQLDAAAMTELKRAFARLPRMSVHLWQRIGDETLLQTADLATFTQAARQYPKP